MGLERFDMTQEDQEGSYSLSGWYTYDDETLDIERLDWDNTFPYDLLVTISSPGRPDVNTTLRAGRGGFRGNVPGSYKHDTTFYEIRRAP